METKTKIVMAFCLGSLFQYLGTLLLMPTPLITDYLTLDKFLVMYGYDFTSNLLMLHDTQLIIMPFILGCLSALLCGISLSYYVFKK